MSDFALLGAAGFVAPRHLRAIAETGNRLVAAMDPSDSVGTLDQYFPEAHFFTEFEHLERHVEILRRNGAPVTWVSVCSPNYLHDAHIRFALRNDANVICEKPLVLEPSDLDALEILEQETGRQVHNVLQLRLHPSLQRLHREVRERLDRDPTFKPTLDLTYVTSRGRWYHSSWKGAVAKSGGIATNIGIHFFDMLLWIFGGLKNSEVHQSSGHTAAGSLELAHANVNWLLSIDPNSLPKSAVERGQRTYRSLRMEGAEIEFSEGFTDLHTETYRHILSQGGFRLRDARPAIELAARIRDAK